MCLFVETYVDVAFVKLFVQRSALNSCYRMALYKQKIYVAVVIGFLLCVSRLNLARWALFALAPCLLQESLQPLLPGLLTTLQDQVERVEERVDGGVDRQHEDGHGHVDLTGDRHTARLDSTTPSKIFDLDLVLGVLLAEGIWVEYHVWYFLLLMLL